MLIKFYWPSNIEKRLSLESRKVKAGEWPSPKLWHINITNIQNPENVVATKSENMTQIGHVCTDSRNSYSHVAFSAQEDSQS